MALIQLIYVSSMNGEDEAVLADILASAVRHNQDDAVTGMLLYYRGGFMQVLEGEDAVVHATYARIRQDPRHHEIVMISLGAVPDRDFSGWSMGFREIDAAAVARFPAHARFFDFKKQSQMIRGKPGLALELLKLFSNDMA